MRLAQASTPSYRGHARHFLVCDPIHLAKCGINTKQCDTSNPSLLQQSRDPRVPCPSRLARDAPSSWYSAHSAHPGPNLYINSHCKLQFTIVNAHLNGFSVLDWPKAAFNLNFKKLHGSESFSAALLNRIYSQMRY